MPKPVGSDQRYMPGLDGLRAIAVLAVIFFHEQFSWAPGGILGVAVFFTLSGYLITDLLLNRWLLTGRLQLAKFWLARARRLLPALFVMLAIVTAWVTVLDRARLGSLRGMVLAAATYWSNWYAIIQGQSYFTRFAPPQPLDHLWSLAVEEQFYLIWPWLLLLGVICLRHRRSTSAIRWLALPTLALAAASAIAMYALYHPAVDATRIYEGTDTRAAGLLIGAALAMVWPSMVASRARRVWKWVLDLPSFAGLAVIVLMVWRVGQYSPLLYRGGLVLLSFATAAVVAACACPGSVTGATLGWRPLRWIGVRSYGIYLWHYPVIVLTSPANGAPVPLPRALGQIAVSIAIAALSWKFVEEPVRHGAIARAWRGLRSRHLTNPGMAKLATVLAAAGVLVVAGAGLAGVGTVPPAAGATAGTAALGGSGALSASTNSVSHASSKHKAGKSPSPAPDSGPILQSDLRTSCNSVVHIGDSTSDGLISPDYLPHKSERIQARYEDVGVQTVYTNITGARSVVEVLPGTTNAYDAAKHLISTGFSGCWVLALGTNDTADVAVGSNVGLAARIAEMMRVTKGEPVMWVNVISLLHSGPYAEANMLKWDTALTQACARYPNMRVFDWSALAKPGWFINDGIHYTSAGYAKRALYIADGLAMSFPAGGPNSSCLVSLPSSLTTPAPSPSPSSPSPSSPSPGSQLPGTTPATSPASSSSPAARGTADSSP